MLSNTRYGLIILCFWFICFGTETAHAAALQIQEEGSSLGYCSKLNFAGATLEATKSGLLCTITDNGAGGSTTWSSIGDPTTAQTISFGDAEITTFDGANEDEIFMTFSNSVADLTADMTMIKITVVDNDDANYIPLSIHDDSDGTEDTIFLVGSLGEISIGDAGIKLTGSDGDLTILSLGDGSVEDLNINLDDTANTAVLTSSTGLNKVDFSAIGVELNQDINITLGAQTLDHDGTHFVFNDSVNVSTGGDSSVEFGNTVTADPCGTGTAALDTGALYYSSGGFFCYCDSTATSVDLKVSDNAACSY